MVITDDLGSSGIGSTPIGSVHSEMSILKVKNSKNKIHFKGEKDYDKGNNDST